MKAMTLEEFKGYWRHWLTAEQADEAKARIALALEQREALLSAMMRIAYPSIHGRTEAEILKIARDAIARCES